MPKENAGFVSEVPIPPMKRVSVKSAPAPIHTTEGSKEATARINLAVSQHESFAEATARMVKKAEAETTGRNPRA